MKKIVNFILILFTCISFYAEQPFFLQNWIIPDDFEWGADKYIPSIPGKRFFQNMESGNGKSNVNFYNKNRSNVDFPPYFLENGLLDWNMTYSEILQSFKDNDKFFTYDYIYSFKHLDNYSDGIEFLDIIRIVCREDNHFEIELYFPHTRTKAERNQTKASYCYIFYVPKGLSTFEDHVPQKEIFETAYRDKWNKNTPEEKLVIALSYYQTLDYNYKSLNYDCTESIYGKKLNPAILLNKTWSITNREELLDYLMNHKEKTILPVYKQLSTIIDAYPNKEILEITAKKNYSVPYTSLMFFIQNMRDHIGKYGIDPYWQERILFVLRMGVGAGYITKEESLEYALPITAQILNKYNSFEDYTAHLAACESFLGIQNLTYADRVADFLNEYNDIQKFINLDEINFTGNAADSALSFDDAYYKPTGEALWWCRVQKEYNNKNGKELDVVKYEISKYPDALCLYDLILKMRPKTYNSDEYEYWNNFFDANYKDVWNKLPENEKYAIAFSSNLFELNHQYHLDFENSVKLDDDSADSKELLRDSWNINNYDELIETFYSLEDYGHSGVYKTLSDLIDKYPGKTPVQIASIERLSILDTTRLHFVYDTRNLLGKHGIEAWDEGREITILRWGISAGYISSEEAMSLIEPVIKRIRQNYTYFEDYICHYIMGRQFYALYNGDYEKLGKAAQFAWGDASAYIPFYELEFTAENAEPGNNLYYLTCIYKPSDLFLQWEKVMNLYRQDAGENTIEQVVKLENENPEYKNILFFWHISLLNYFNQFEDVINFAEQNMTYLQSFAFDSEVYVSSMYFYISSLNNCFSPAKALQIYDSLPDQVKGNIYYYYQFAYSNYLMINFAENQNEMNYYKQRAINALKILKNYDFDIGERLEGWLESVEN